MKYRISKVKLATMPKEVADQIERLGKEYGIKSFTYESKPEGSKIYASEGSRFTFIYGKEVKSVEIVASHNVGAANVSYAINSKITPLVGTTVIEIWYYSGFGMKVVNIGERALNA